MASPFRSVCSEKMANAPELPQLRPRQPLLLPPDLRDWLDDDHLAWFVIDAVKELELEPFYASYRADGHGAAAHDPQMMVNLFAYAYAVGERSSRAIKRRCREDVAFRVICAESGPRPRHDRALSRSPPRRPGGALRPGPGALPKGRDADVDDPGGQSGDTAWALRISFVVGDDEVIMGTPATWPAPAAGGFEACLPGLQVGLGCPLALSPRRTPTVLPEKHLEQIANPSLLRLLRQGMTQR